MKKRILTASMILMTILAGSGVRADVSLLTEKPESSTRAEPTAVALYDHDNAKYVGYDNGSIHSVNTTGDVVLVKPGLGKIESVANTAGSNGLGAFTFSAGGRVYTGTKRQDLQFPGIAGKIYYDANGGLLASDKSAFYRYSEGKWNKIGKLIFNDAEITAFSRSSKGLVAAVRKDGKNSLVRYDSVNEKWEPVIKTLDREITDMKVSDANPDVMNLVTSDKSGLAVDIAKKSEVKFESCLTENSSNTSPWALQAHPLSVYITFKSYAAVPSPKTSHPDEAIYSITISGRGITQKELFTGWKNNPSDTNWDGGYNGMRYTIDLAGQESQTKYYQDALPLSPLNYQDDRTGGSAVLNPGLITFDWKGPVSPVNNPVSVTISEHVYQTNNSDYETDASCDIVVPNGQVTYILPSPDMSWMPADISSYSFTDVRSSQQFQANSTQAPGFCATGTCATAIDIMITRSEGGSTVNVDPSDPIYDHIAFFYYVGNSPYLDPVKGYVPVGADIYDPDTSYMALIPAVNPNNPSRSEVEIDGIPKYFFGNPAKKAGYRRFYLFLGKDVASGSGQQNITLVPCFIDNTGRAISVPQGLTVNPQNVVPGTSSLTDTSGRGHTFNQTNESSFAIQQIYYSSGVTGSNWEGYIDPNNGTLTHCGYMDYYTPATPVNPGDTPKGVWWVFPQGMNDLDFNSRLRPALMKVGYYLKPDPTVNSITDGLHCTQYDTDDKPSYCHGLYGKPQLYAYAFDSVGNYVAFCSAVTGYDALNKPCSEDQIPMPGTGSSTTSPITLGTIWNTYDPNNANKYTLIRLDNRSNVPICMSAHVDTGKVDTQSNNMETGVSYDHAASPNPGTAAGSILFIPCSGVFLPPNNNMSVTTGGPAAVPASQFNFTYKDTDFLTEHQCNINYDVHQHLLFWGHSMWMAGSINPGTGAPMSEYFTAGLDYNNYDGIYTLEDVPQSTVRSRSGSNSSQYLFLPLNQIFVWDDGNPGDPRRLNLLYYGVSYIPWDQSCAVANYQNTYQYQYQYYESAPFLAGSGIVTGRWYTENATANSGATYCFNPYYCLFGQNNHYGWDNSSTGNDGVGFTENQTTGTTNEIQSNAYVDPSTAESNVQIYQPSQPAPAASN